MANNPSAIKRIRLNEDRRQGNQPVHSDMRTSIKRVNAAIQAKDTDLAKNELKLAVSKIDKAVQRGIIHRNNGARKKSALMSKVDQLAQ